MRVDPPLPIAAAAVWYPPATERGLPVCTELHPPEMAVKAATLALVQAGWDPASVDLVLHAWTHHQGHDFWSPAHYVARFAGALAAVPIGVQQMCNGGAIAIELAAAQLRAGASRALVTTADRFTAPGFDRFEGDYGIVYGDAATALLLGGDAGSLQLEAIATHAAPELEAMHRGPFTAMPRAPDVRARKRAFLEANGRESFERRARAGVREAVRRALEDASPATARCIALPRLGAQVIDAAYRPALAGLEALPVSAGHLGAGDAAANVALLAETLEPGEVGLVLSAGAGFSWTCAALRRL